MKYDPSFTICAKTHRTVLYIVTKLFEIHIAPYENVESSMPITTFIVLFEESDVG